MTKSKVHLQSEFRDLPSGYKNIKVFCGSDDFEESVSELHLHEVNCFKCLIRFKGSKEE